MQTQHNMWPEEWITNASVNTQGYAPRDRKHRYSSNPSPRRLLLIGQRHCYSNGDERSECRRTVAIIFIRPRTGDHSSSRSSPSRTHDRPSFLHNSRSDVGCNISIPTTQKCRKSHFHPFGSWIGIEQEARLPTIATLMAAKTRTLRWGSLLVYSAGDPCGKKGMKWKIPVSALLECNKIYFLDQCKILWGNWRHKKKLFMSSFGKNMSVNHSAKRLTVWQLPCWLIIG